MLLLATPQLSREEYYTIQPTVKNLQHSCATSSKHIQINSTNSSKMKCKLVPYTDLDGPHPHGTQCPRKFPCQVWVNPASKPAQVLHTSQNLTQEWQHSNHSAESAHQPILYFSYSKATKLIHVISISVTNTKKSIQDQATKINTLTNNSHFTG